MSHFAGDEYQYPFRNDLSSVEFHVKQLHEVAFYDRTCLEVHIRRRVGVVSASDRSRFFLPNKIHFLILKQLWWMNKDIAFSWTDKVSDF